MSDRPPRILTLATTLALAAAAAGTARAAPAIEVTTQLSRPDALEVRLQGDAGTLARRRTVVGADRVIRIWLSAPATPRTMTLAKGPAHRVTVRRIGKRSVVSIHTREAATALARRVRFIEEKGALTAALFSDNGALAEWIAAHAGARIRMLPVPRSVAAAPVVARRAAAENPIVLVGVPTVLSANADTGTAADASIAPPVPFIAQIAQAAAEATAPVATPARATPAPVVVPPKAPIKPSPSNEVVALAPAPGESPDRTRAAIFGALLVLGGAFLWFRRRAGRMPADPASIRVLSSCGLGGKHRVSVLEVGSDRFLVGMDTGGARLISRLGTGASRRAHESVAPAAMPADRRPLAPAPTPVRTSAAPAQTLARTSAAAAEPAPARTQSPAATFASAVGPALQTHLTLVGAPGVEPEPVAERRARTLTPVTDLSRRRTTEAPRSVPLARLATHAVPASPPPARPTAPAQPRTRVAPEPQRPSATGPTVFSIAAETLYEADVEGLLRLKSAARKAA